MGVENGYGARKNNVTSRHGLRGPWTVVSGGFVEEIFIENVEDLIVNDMTKVTPYAVGEDFGPKAMGKFSEWLEKRQPKNGK